MSATGSGLVEAIGWALVHFLWQGALAAAVFAGVDAALRGYGSRARYALAAVTLTAMALLPAVTLIASRATAAWPPAERGTVIAASPVRVQEVEAAPPTVRGWALDAAGALRGRLSRALPMVVGLWCTGVLLLSLRFLGGWRLVRSLDRGARPLTDPAASGRLSALARRIGVARPVRLLESARVDVPTVVGWLRPAILLPVATLAGLSPDQVEALLAHELAHVRRHDYLAGLLQGAVETLLFYHPAVWWVSHRMRVLREMCCDDEAVVACGDPVRYARALARLESLRPGPSLAPAATGGGLLERITRLVGSEPERHVARASRLSAMALFAGAVVVGVSGLASLHAAAGRTTSEPRAAASPEPSTPAPPARQAPTAAPAASAGRAVPIERVLELARAGVTPEYVDGMAAAGHPELSWDQLIALRHQGVGPEYVQGLAALGYTGLTPDQLVSLRSQGVSPDYIRGLAGERLEGLTLSEVLQLRTQGVSPEYVHALRAAGYDRLSVTDLLGARSNGVSGEDAAALRDLGYKDVSVERLIALRATGVGVEYIRGLQAAGYRGLTLPTLIGLRSQGVSVEYVRDLGKLGYTGLSAGELIELRSNGVSPEWVRELQEAGAGHLSTSELVELRSHGVDARLLKRIKARGEANQ